MTTNYVQSLWSKAIHLRYKHCVFCGDVFNLQAHHFIKRRHALLKNDYRNGFLLCTQCHKKAHTKAGEQALIKFMGQDRFDYLSYRENVFIKDFLLENNLSREEFNKKQANELKQIIEEYK